MRMGNKKSLNITQITLCALFTALIAVGAFIKIPLPAVPFTLQFLFSNLAGLLLGKRLGSISVAVYIAVGLAGLPIFAAGGGPAYIFQPTFGYVLGYLPGTYAAGYIMEKSHPKTYRIRLIASFANFAIVYALGMGYYYFIANYYLNSSIGVWAIILHCFILPLPGRIILCITSASLSQRLNPIMKRG